MRTISKQLPFRPLLPMPNHNPQNESDRKQPPLPRALPGHVHIIGVCGVLSSALACALHRAGVKVTGSDKGFYPPVSTQLERIGVPFYAGWHPEKMVAHGVPDLVIVATASGSHNPETAYAREHNLTIVSYTEVLHAYFIQPQSIVCVGTWGKTTTSAILSFILLEAGYDPSYMFGGVSLSHDLSALIGKGTVSVLEGDEYKSGTDDPNAKFFYYAPTHLLMTGLAWDHADLYPTLEDYMEAFRKLVRMTAANAKALAETHPTLAPQSNRTIVACIDDEALMELLESEHIRPITYGKDSHAAYRYENVHHTTKGTSFDIVHGGKKYTIESPMLGRYNVENIAGCFAMAHSIGVAAESIVSAIARFQGIKRRLERRLDGMQHGGGGISVIDAHAPTPDKAAACLESLSEVYTDGLIAIFEPNIGGRQKSTADKYDHAFKNAAHVFIPRLTKLKIDFDAKPEDQPIEGPELCATIARTHTHTSYIEDDEALVAKAIEYAQAQAAAKGGTETPRIAIVFLGSHGFRGMIEEAVKKLQR